ncbi:MAG: MaoC family dehydratase N-terminal domain-containing protein [Caulobacterales bacterium]
MNNEIDAILERLRGRIGREGPPISKTVEQGALIKFAKAIGETNPLYLDVDYAKASRFGVIIAPPTYVSTFVQLALTPDLFDLNLPLKRFLHSDDVVKNYLPIKAGDIITAQARFTDAYTRAGANGPLVFQAVEIALTNENSEKVSNIRVVSVNFH